MADRARGYEELKGELGLDHTGMRLSSMRVKPDLKARPWARDACNPRRSPRFPSTEPPLPWRRGSRGARTDKLCRTGVGGGAVGKLRRAVFGERRANELGGKNVRLTPVRSLMGASSKERT
jgi:hypothetical protein